MRIIGVEDALHNSCEAVVTRIGMGYKAFLQPIARFALRRFGHMNIESDLRLGIYLVQLKTLRGTMSKIFA
jgi:hypothetical protein